MDDLLSCPVCFEEFTEKCPAKLLKLCGHYFCLKCLIKLYEKSDKKGQIRCPLCNHRTHFHTEGFFGRKRPSKAEELRKIVPDCFALKTLVKLSSQSPRLEKHEEATLLPDLLTCKCCTRKLDNPRMLPYCQHSFCLECLKKAFKAQNEKSLKKEACLTCPECKNKIAFVPVRKNVSLPGAQLLGSLLPVDYATSTLLNMLQS